MVRADTGIIQLYMSEPERDSPEDEMKLYKVTCKSEHQNVLISTAFYRRLPLFPLLVWSAEAPSTEGFVGRDSQCRNGE